jgi:hypothetical protein
MDNLVRNERLKLLANALDRASTACITIGFITPLAAVVYAAGATGLSTGFFVVAGVSWILLGLGLHLLAHQVLGGLR